MRSNYSYTSCWRTQVSWPHSDDYNHTKLELILIFFNNFHPGWSSDKSSLRLYGTPLPSVEAEPIPLLCDPSHHPPVPHRDLWHNAVHLWTPGIHQSSDREGKIYRVHFNFLFYFYEIWAGNQCMLSLILLCWASYLLTGLIKLTSIHVSPFGSFTEFLCQYDHLSKQNKQICFPLMQLGRCPPQDSPGFSYQRLGRDL